MILDAYRISVLVLDNDASQLVRSDVLAPLLCIPGLHDNHEPSIPALVEQPANRRTLLDRRDNLDKVAA